jgi:hypothetical protein
MSRGFVPPQVHGVLDYPLAAVLVAGPLVLDFDYKAAAVIALAFGGVAVVQAVATNWPTGIVKAIPPLVHGHVDAVVLVAMIVLPFAFGFSCRTPALLFYIVVGGVGLLAKRFESLKPRNTASDDQARCIGRRPSRERHRQSRELPSQQAIALARLNPRSQDVQSLQCGDARVPR